jgi:hypothetical protein
MSEHFSLEIYQEILSHVDDSKLYYNCTLVCTAFRKLLLEMRDNLLRKLRIQKITMNPDTMNPDTTKSVRTHSVNDVKHGYKHTFYDGMLHSTIPYVLGKRDGVAFLSCAMRKIFYQKDRILKESFMNDKMEVHTEFLNGKASKNAVINMNDRGLFRSILYNKWIRREYVFNSLTFECKETFYICGKKYKKIWASCNKKLTKYYKGKTVYIYNGGVKQKKKRRIILTKRKYD